MNLRGVTSEYEILRWLARLGSESSQHAVRETDDSLPVGSEGVTRAVKAVSSRSDHEVFCF